MGLMQTIRDAAYRLTDQMQCVIGHLELERPKDALQAAEGAIQTLHLLYTAIAAKTAEFDALAGELRQRTLELATTPRSRKRK